jgi:catalase-peroxidase
MDTAWTKSEKEQGIYEGRDRASGKLKWTATPVDLVFGSHAELRAIAEVYAANGGEEKFVNDFVDAWNKVMMLDRFDVARPQQGTAVASR